MLTYKGRWWLSTDEKHEYVGTLVCDPCDGLTLELIVQNVSSDKGLASAFSREGKSEYIPLVVHGQTHNGTLFTLYDGFVTNSLTGSAGSATINFLFNRGIRGACIPNPSRLQVHRIFARYYGLEAWLAINPFKVDSEMQPPYKVTVVHESPEAIIAAIDANRSFVVRWMREGPKESIVQNDLTITSKPYAGIEYKEPVTIDDAHEDSGVLADLFTLLLGAPTAAYDIDFRSPEIAEEHGDTALYSLRAAFRPKDILAKWTPDDVLLSLPRVRKLLDQIVMGWFGIHRRCRSAVVPYFANKQIPAPFVNSRCFDAARAAEAIHRELKPDDKEFSDVEAEQIRCSIMREVPGSREQSVRDCLARVNELSFRARIVRLMDRFPDMTTDIIGDANAQKQFAQTVRDFRISEAHLLEKNKRHMFDGAAYHGLLSKLHALIDAWLLAELGIPDKEISDAMRSNRRYWFYASHMTCPWQK